MQKLTNVAGFDSINAYINYKLDLFSREEKNCKTLFRYMFSERENTMAETSDGYRIKKLTYGQCFDEILRLVPSMKELVAAPHNSIVGLYMQNSSDWIKMFWGILACGYRPILMNSRISDAILEKMIEEYGVFAVISDGKKFSVPTVNFEDIKPCEVAAVYDELDFADEVIFMSSGTSESIKLCSYTGENFYYQICDSSNIIKLCPEIKGHYDGELKHLAVLPFYHVFGFIAVYLWFGFFSRTFVFLKDMRPQTLLNTIKKHKVTHIFAVPMVWEKVRSEALKKIEARGEKTYAKFCKAIKLSNKGGALGKLVRKFALKEVRDGLFGDSVLFLISGGSSIKQQTLEFFNGVGYHIANGYGMTEVGITSVEISSKNKILNSGSVGSPFAYTQYKISDSGELLIKGKTRADSITQNGVRTKTNYDEWFCSRDLATCTDGRYYVHGRADDLIIGSDGENISPDAIEAQLNIPHADRLCLFRGEDGTPILIISATKCYSHETLDLIMQSAKEQLKETRVDKVVKRIIVTTDSLMSPSEFKVSRKRIARIFAGGGFNLIDGENREVFFEAATQLEREVKELFAQALRISPDEIKLGDDFFMDLGGTSLDYFTLVDSIKSKYGTDIPSNLDKTLSTVKEICDFIKKRT